MSDGSIMRELRQWSRDQEQKRHTVNAWLSGLSAAYMLVCGASWLAVGDLWTGAWFLFGAACLVGDLVVSLRKLGVPW